MRVIIKIPVVLPAVFFSFVTMAGDMLSLYASSSGSAALKSMNGSHSILILAGGNDAGQATSGNCVISASLLPVKGGFVGELVPVDTGINSYDKNQAQGKKISIDSNPDELVVSDLDYVGICALDNSLINVYKKINLNDRGYVQIYSEMIALAHADALATFKKGNVGEAINKLSSFANNYEVSWLAEKDLAGAVISAINDYAYFLQENNQAMESIVFLNDVVKAEPDRAVSWLNLADSNWMVGKKNEAASEYAKYENIMLSKNNKSKIPSRVIERINITTGN